HKSYIEQALKEGKTVPEEVLKDYPDLAEKYLKSKKLYEGLTPGTPEWMRVWREHPELQEEMLEYARTVKEVTTNWKDKVFVIAQKAVGLYKKEIPSSVYDDVVQEVATRMLEKLSQWDKSKGKLETFLISAIKPQIPEIITNLTKVMRIPRPTQERLTAYNREVEKIRKEKGREPTEEEINAILKKLHISKETLEAATREIISLSQPVPGSEELVIEDMIKGKEQQNIVEDLVKKQIPSLIKRLPPLHQKVIELYFGFTPDGKTYTASQIAEFLNIPLNRVETLLTEALRKLADMEEIVTLKASRALEDLKFHAGVYMPHPYAEKIREVVLHLKGMIKDVFRGLVGKLKAGLRKKRTEKIINEISAQLTRTEEGFKDLRKELKMEIEKYTPQGYKTLEEWAEAVKKMPEPTFIEFFSHAYATFSRLKIPEVARWISDAFFYSRYIADERINQFHALCEAIFGRSEIPQKYHKKMIRVLEGKEPVPEEWKMLVDWWESLAKEMYEKINEAREEIGLEPIREVRHYLYRRLNDIARTYLDSIRILNGKAVIGDLPAEILQNIRFFPPHRTTIPMIFERTIENPDQILEWINSERAKKGLPPLESIYETDPNKLILATIYAETRYPYLLRALRNIQERKKTLPPATQEFIDNWLKYQVLGRVHPIDRSINKAIEIVTKPLRAVGINLGKNPIAAITRFYGRALHFGVLGFNIPLAGLNALQLFHNVAINGFVSTMKAIEALVLGLNVKGYSPAWKLLKFSRIVRNRYPYELTVAADLTTLERMGALLYRSADFLNITTAFLGHLLTRYKLYPEFRNKVKPFIKDTVVIELTGKTRKLKGVEKILQGILEAAERGLIWDDLYKADYYAYIAQYPYER
ncbi:MAG TPA: hypothetical protein ENG66_07810, partial [Thermococcus sp.]|nr:hypothetical protein [Thermococcus sp.]